MITDSIKDVLEYCNRSGYKNVHTVLLAQYLEDIECKRETDPMLVKLHNITAKYLCLTFDEIMSNYRNEDYVYARHIISFIAMRKFPNMSYLRIKKYFNLKSHATVMHGVSKIADEYDSDKRYNYKFNIKDDVNNIIEIFEKLKHEEGI